MQITNTTILSFLLAQCLFVASINAADPVDDAGSEIDQDGITFFEQHIRPMFVKHCYSCHSSSAIRPKGKLLLDSRQGIAKGGEGGAIVVPHRPNESRLITALRWTDSGLQMPPNQALSADQVKFFEQWIEMGAPDPRDSPDAADSSEQTLTAEEAGRSWWAFTPVERSEVPTGVTDSTNPIDAFIAERYRDHQIQPVGRSDRLTLLRRVYLDLIGIPPTPAEQEAFLSDSSPDAYRVVVDRLLANEQHGVRYGRHWLDVLRYADVDERMLSAPGIHLWRDWVVNSLNDNLPYDQFVRAQLTGYRSTERTQMSSTGRRFKAEPRPDDLFALGFLSRGAVIRDGKGEGELAISAVDTVSTAFMGMTVGCAKCHNHVYDPITQRDFYAMKALFDPLVPRKVTLATVNELIASGRASQEVANRRGPIDAKMNALLVPYKKKLYDERVAMLPDDVQKIVMKPERDRSVAEQKIADDYFPILRIDTGKVLEIMPDEERKAFQSLERELQTASKDQNTRDQRLAAFWTVEVDGRKELDKSYILTSGDPERPELNHEVSPGWPFASSTPDFRDGRVEAFSDWLTSPDNPLFARVAVNRIWQWHFGEGLQKSPSDFGKLGGVPSNPKLLDWLASEFVKQNFDMKEIHRLIVTSETYQLASEAQPDAASQQADPTNAFLWHFPLQRLEAESIWDSIFAAAGVLDLKLGGSSFSLNKREDRRGKEGNETFRRAAYLTRGFSTSNDVMPNFLQAFDVDDGRVSCPVRTQTVTPTQGLFMMNSREVEQACLKFADRLQKESNGDLRSAIELGYRLSVCRAPSSYERERALVYLDNDVSKLKGLAWLLFNLDEFIYLR